MYIIYVINSILRSLFITTDWCNLFFVESIYVYFTYAIAALTADNITL